LQICHHSITAADCRHDLTSHIFNLKRGFGIDSEVLRSYISRSCDKIDCQLIVFIKRQAAYLGLPLNLYLFENSCEQMYGVSYNKWL
jgi:hypothetical protein